MVIWSVLTSMVSCLLASALFVVMRLELPAMFEAEEVSKRVWNRKITRRLVVARLSESGGLTRLGESGYVSVVA